MSDTLKEAQAWLRVEVENGGAQCPCCTQYAKVYRRRIHAAMAVDLIRAYRRYVDEWFFLPNLVGDRGTGDVTKCRYWGLLEQQEGEREDGSSRTGWWRLTDLGCAFVLHRAKVPKLARIYDGRSLGLVHDGDTVTISDCLGDKFDYRELMND